VVVGVGRGACRRTRRGRCGMVWARLCPKRVRAVVQAHAGHDPPSGKAGGGNNVWSRIRWNTEGEKKAIHAMSSRKKRLRLTKNEQRARGQCGEGKRAARRQCRKVARSRHGACAARAYAAAAAGAVW